MSIDELSLLQEDWFQKLLAGRKIHKILEEPGCEPGENFASKIIRLKIYFKDSSEEEFLPILIKMMHPPESYQNQLINCSAMFENEKNVYTMVFPELIQPEHKQYFLELIHSAPRYIVFKDLKYLGYKLGDRNKGLDEDECLLVLEAMACLHSQSFNLQCSRPEAWNKCCGVVQETIFHKIKSLDNKFWETALALAIDSIRVGSKPVLLNAAEHLNKLRGRVIDTILSYTEDRSPFCVLCHGDLWINNIMLRYIDGKAQHVKLLDFQGMRQASCGLDILHLLCTSVSSNVWKSFQKLVQHYYNSLQNMTQSIPFSFEQLRDELRSKVAFGLLIAFVIIPSSDPSDGQILHRGGTLSESSQRKIRKLMENVCEVGLFPP